MTTNHTDSREAIDLLIRDICEMCEPEETDERAVRVNVDWLRSKLMELPALAQSAKAEPVGWKPIETAPKDNKRLLMLAVIHNGVLRAVDFNGLWQEFDDGGEDHAIQTGYGWTSEQDIGEPTHWTYQDELFTTPQPQACKVPDAAEPPEAFKHYIRFNLPKGTVIGDPEWWIKRLWRAAVASADNEEVKPTYNLSVAEQGVLREALLNSTKVKP